MVALMKRGFAAVDVSKQVSIIYLINALLQGGGSRG
jgi:hypothetical protein